MIRSAVNLLPPPSKIAPLVIAIASLATGAASAKTSDRDQTMHVDASGSDCSVSDNGPCVLTGNVHIVQGTLDIQSQRADIRRSDGETKTVKLTGAPVKLKQQNDDGGWLNATADQIDYDLPNDTVVLTGNANVLQPGKGSMRGGRIVYNTRTGQVQSGGAEGGGPVSMTFEPKKKAAPAKPDAKPGAAPAAPPADKPQDDAPQDKK